MNRNNTSFPIKINTVLQKLYKEYKESDKTETKLLHFYQYYPKYLLENNIIDSRGILIYLPPGLGKTRLAAAVAAVSKRVIVIEPQSLHANFEKNMQFWREETGQYSNINYITSNAYNTGEKVQDVSFENCLLIVDEAHMLFKSIINGSVNAQKIYNKIMNTVKIKILFLTGTPVSKSPFELVPCFNMLTGKNLFPVDYNIFYKLYIEKGHMINKEKFMNRIVGLVSHVEHEKLDVGKKPGDDGWFPRSSDTIIIKVEMSDKQYVKYSMWREKEEKEVAKASKRPPKPLTLPGKSESTSYYIHSRMSSNFTEPEAENLSNDHFTKEMSPKLHLIAEKMSACKGKTIAYSQFVESGLNPLARYLEVNGMEKFDLDELKKGGRDRWAQVDTVINKIMKTEISKKKKVKFEKNLCKYDTNSFVDPSYTDIEKEIVRDIISKNLNIEDYRFYNEHFKIPKGFSYRDTKLMKLVVNLHHGQRKLFMCELQLLTKMLKSWDQTATILYAGSAAGYHLPFLHELFPNLKFILWDPAPFCSEVMKDKKSFEVHNDFFTDEVAAKYIGVDFFISDIRVSSSNSTSEEFEHQVDEDMAAQMRWTKIIKPKICAFLKFRPPYVDNLSIHHFDYLDGQVMVQTWPPRRSTEGRLIVTDYETTRKWNANHYQDYFSYHNIIIREWVTFNVELDIPGFDRCFDCTNEYTSWVDYIAFRDDDISIHKEKVVTFMKRLSTEIRQPLLCLKSLHGYMSEKPICAKRERLYNMVVAEIGGGGTAGKYAILTGDVPSEDRAKIVELFNRDDNKYGANIKCLLTSEVGATGIDLKSVLETHQVEPFWDATREEQFKKRAIRLGSHDQLPIEEREVESFMYLSVRAGVKTIDEEFYDDSKRTQVLIKEFTDALTPVSLECTILDGNCHTCAPTDKQLYAEDPAADINTPNQCVPIEETAVVTKEIEYKGNIYHYVEDDSTITGYKFFVFDDKYDSYVEYNGDEIFELLEIIK